MKKIIFIYTIVLAALITACTDDPFKDFEGSDWKKERNITSILLDGQIGTATIERKFDDASITIYAKLENIADISKVVVKNIEFAFGASSDILPGTVLDFSNDTAYISVKSGAGKTLDWVVTILPFKSDLEGSWYIGEIGMYCDMFSWESWGWEEYLKIPDFLPAVSPELDNVITFEVVGADENGNPYGTYTHSPGNDNVFGDYADEAKGWDFNERYRKIPMGEGTWLRDFERNKVIITDKNNVEFELDLELLPESNEVSLKAVLPYLSDQFNWTDTDWDYEKLAHMSNPMWYKLNRNYVKQTGNNILSLSVESQTGSATIDNDNKYMSLSVSKDQIADLSSVEVEEITLSLLATSAIKQGSLLDFSVGDSTTFKVVSESGDEAVWTVHLQGVSQTSAIEGTWSILAIEAHCDYFSWEDWGNTETLNIIEKLAESAPEKDNIIKFVQDATDNDGNHSGTYSNAAGPDAAYGDFVNTTKSWDMNSRYRQFPKGDGTWVHNIADNKVTITVGSDEVVVDLTTDTNNETITLTAQLTYESEKFNWTDPDYDYEKLFHLTKSMWYTLNNRVDNN